VNPGKISVIVPTYNRDDLLPRALDSILHQTRLPDEIIVVDDGSTDNTAEVIKPYIQQGIRYLPKQNGGPSSARNLGIQSATGEFIGFLDSDDQWQPEYLSLTSDLLHKNPSAAVVFTDAALLSDQDGKIIEPSYNWSFRREAFTSLVETQGNWSGCFDHDTFRKAQVRVCLVVMSTALVRAQAFQKTGLFDCRYRVSEDYELWLRMSRFYNFCYIDQPLLISHIHGDNLTQQPKLQAVFRRNNREALKAELLWEQNPSIREVIQDQLNKNWETEISSGLRERDRTKLQQTLREARKDGWSSSRDSMRRIKIVDRCGPSIGFMVTQWLTWMGR
jgi:glycosyltransferase involved in cell wall biosynthesis